MSLLVERFAAARGGSKPRSAEDEIVQCVKALRRRLGLRAAAPGRLEPFLASRNIRDVAMDDDLKADGALVPLGAEFGAGFRMILRRDLPKAASISRSRTRYATHFSTNACRRSSSPLIPSTRRKSVFATAGPRNC